MEESKEQNEN